MESEIFKGRFLRLITEDKNGQVFERVYLRDTVLIIPITAENNIRFVREHDWNRDIVKTKLVSGYIEENETPEECARRELEEELGLIAAQWQPFIKAVKKGSLQTTQHFFIARELQETQAKADKEERIEGYIDFPLPEVRERTLKEEFGQTATAFALLKLFEQLYKKQVLT